MSHANHERSGEICRTCAKVGRSEALTEARDAAADYERDASECLARARAPDRQSMKQRLEVARKIRQRIEGLENAPAPLRADTTTTLEMAPNVIPIDPAARRKGGPKRRK